MNKLGKHYQRRLCHGGLIVGVPLSLDLTQLIDQGDRENHNVVIRRILIFNK
jgi:NAD-dependent oxidoreductase involved in siderophore biosynthesis